MDCSPLRALMQEVCHISNIQSSSRVIRELPEDVNATECVKVLLPDQHHFASKNYSL